MPSRRPRYEFALGRPREPALGGSSYVGASRWIWEIELSFRQVKGLQQVRRFEQLTGLMRRRFSTPDAAPPLPWIQRPNHSDLCEEPTRHRDGSSRKTTRQPMVRSDGEL